MRIRRGAALAAVVVAAGLVALRLAGYGVFQDYPVLSNVWVGTPIHKANGGDGLPPWERVVAETRPGLSSAQYNSIFAPEGVDSNYIVIAYGRERTLGNLVLGGAGRPAVFRGYRPCGEFMESTRDGVAYRWRPFSIETGWCANRKAREFAGQIERDGFRVSSRGD